MTQNKSAAAAAAKSVQSCLTLCDPIDSSPPDSTVPGILQARTLEWGAIAFSRISLLIINDQLNDKSINKVITKFQIKKRFEVILYMTLLIRL